MEVKDYCRAMETELAGWKAKIYDLSRKIENLPTADKEKVSPHVEDLHIIVEELTARIDQLEKECPSEWGPQRSEIYDRLARMKAKYEDTWGELRAYWG